MIALREQVRALTEEKRNAEENASALLRAIEEYRGNLTALRARAEGADYDAGLLRATLDERESDIADFAARLADEHAKLIERSRDVIAAGARRAEAERRAEQAELELEEARAALLRRGAHAVDPGHARIGRWDAGRRCWASNPCPGCEPVLTHAKATSTPAPLPARDTKGSA